MLQKLRAIYSSKYGTLIKVLISFLILGVFIYSIDTKKILQTLKHISTFDVFVLLVLTILRNVVGSVRFKFLCNIRHKLGIWEIMKQYFVASLFNNFLPTAIGGDSIRFVMIAKAGVSKVDAGIMILLERIIGFYALVFISFVSAFFWDVPTHIFKIVLLCFSGYTIILAILLLPRTLIPLKIKNKLFNKISDAFTFYKNNILTLIGTLLISLIYQAVSIYISYYVAIAIGLDTAFIPFLTLVPLVWLFTMIPIGFGGIGLREVSFAYLFSVINIAKEKALIISLGTYLTLVLSGIIGAFLFIFKSNRLPKGQQ